MLPYSCSAVKNLNSRKPLGSPDKKDSCSFLSQTVSMSNSKALESETLVVVVSTPRRLQQAKLLPQTVWDLGLCAPAEGMALSRLCTCLTSFPLPLQALRVAALRVWHSFAFSTLRCCG